MSTVDDEYPCLAVCMIDADGYCIACGRPSLPEPALTQVDEVAGTDRQPPAKPAD
jgi:hypothetical protein